MIKGTVTLEIAAEQVGATRPLAARIQNHAKVMGYTSWGVEADDAMLVRNHELGHLAERVVGDHYGLPVNTTVGDIDSPDLKVLEVRARWNVPGRDQLGIRAVLNDDGSFVPIDKHLKLPHLLARVAEDCRHLLLVGWLLGREAVWLARQHREWWNNNSHCWYIPEEHLHSVTSLEHWLMVGSPLHTWKDPTHGI